MQNCGINFQSRILFNKVRYVIIICHFLGTTDEVVWGINPAGMAMSRHGVLWEDQAPNYRFTQITVGPVGVFAISRGSIFHRKYTHKEPTFDGDQRRRFLGRTHFCTTNLRIC